MPCSAYMLYIVSCFYRDRHGSRQSYVSVVLLVLLFAYSLSMLRFRCFIEFPFGARHLFKILSFYAGKLRCWIF